MKDCMGKSRRESVKGRGGMGVKEEVICKDINNGKKCVRGVGVNGIGRGKEG